MLGAAPCFTCMWLGTVSCWDFGLRWGDSAEPIFPWGAGSSAREPLQLQQFYAALLWLAEQLSPKATQALFVQCAGVVSGCRQCRGGLAPMRSPRQGGLAGLSGSVGLWAAGTGVQGGRGPPRQAVPGRKQPALGFPWVAGQPLAGVALPLQSPTGRRCGTGGRRSVVAGVCVWGWRGETCGSWGVRELLTCVQGRILLAWLWAAAPQPVLCMRGSPQLTALCPSFLPDLQLVHQRQEAAAPRHAA